MAGRRLSGRQSAVLNDIFSGQMSVEEVLAKHKVAAGVYRKWHGDERFSEEFEVRVAAAYRESRVLIARYASVAAVKLVQLTESNSAETSRKACLDILSLNKADKQVRAERKEEGTEGETELPSGLDEKTASRLLEVLAEGKKS